MSEGEAAKSFAWGQWVGGSLISGVSAWKLALRFWHQPTSQVLIGVSNFYDDVRNTVLTPLEFFQLYLNANEKNAFVISGVLLAALARGLMLRRFRDGPVVFGTCVIGMATAALGVLAARAGFAGAIRDRFGSPQVVGLPPEVGVPISVIAKAYVSLHARAWIFMLLYSLVLVGIMTPIGTLASRTFLFRRYGFVFDLQVASDDEVGFAKLQLASVLATFVWGAILFALNSVTS